MENEISLPHPLIKKLLRVGLMCISCETASMSNAKTYFFIHSLFSQTTCCSCVSVQNAAFPTLAKSFEEKIC